MTVLRISAFSDGNEGGNPAGVMLCDDLPTVDFMQAKAREVGFSETVFAAPAAEGRWRARYFSPESEVPFCGHATIALGAALADAKGAGIYALQLNEADITVEGRTAGKLNIAALQSPSTESRLLDEQETAETLALFGYRSDQLDIRLPPAFIHAGANHFMIALHDRTDLAAMYYDLDEGRAFMSRCAMVTIMLVVSEGDRHFHVRNAFASGGVFEDPATGAAAAAFSGYLRDISWPHGGSIDIVQGEDMGMRSIIKTIFGDEPGASIRVSGTARTMA